MNTERRAMELTGMAIRMITATRASMTIRRRSRSYAWRR
jgi:hypothetical protein